MQLDKIKSQKITDTSFRQCGQAMSEFVILLTVLMVMAAGMIYVSRLLNFQYWARQEARFMAFQQTWPARMNIYAPRLIALNTKDKGASDYIRKTSPHRQSTIVGNLSNIMALNNKTNVPDNNAVPEIDQIVLAGKHNSIWERKTSDWYDDIKNSLITPAFAKNREILPADSWENSSQRPSELERGFISLLEECQFGEKFCLSVFKLLKDDGYKAELSPFGNKNCAKDYNTLFGLHLARNVDFRNLFSHYGKLLEAKKSPEEALQMIGTREIKNQFYSLFDKKIKKAMNDAMTFLIEGAESNNNIIAGNFNALLLKAKYKGGKNAVQAIWDFSDPIHNNSGLRKVEAEKHREDLRNQILHADLLTDSILGTKSFDISSVYAPIPADFTKAQAALFDGVMKNVLTNEKNLQPSLIDHTNIQTFVSYPAHHGMFSYLFGRFAMVKKPLSAKFFVFDQPWNISRQVVYQRARRIFWWSWRRGARGYTELKYRDLGGEDDLMSSETETGIMRRRTYGLWLVPSDANAMFSPLSKLTGSDMLDVVSAGGDILNAPGFVKDQLSTLLTGEGLPILKELLNAVRSIPEIFDFDFTPPVLPAVRPEAYPNSKELVDDNLMGSGTDRTMFDYQNEQMSHINNKP